MCPQPVQPTKPVKGPPALGLVVTPPAQVWASHPPRATRATRARPQRPAVVVVGAQALVAEGVARLMVSLRPYLGAEVEVLQGRGREQALDLLARRAQVVLVLLDMHAAPDEAQAAVSALLAPHPDLAVLVLMPVCDRDRVLALVRAGARGVIPDSHPPRLVQGALELVLRFGGVYLPPEAFLAEPSVPQLTPKPVRAADLGLTPRQTQVLQLLLQGSANKHICQQLGLSSATVKNHLSMVLRALKVGSRTQAVLAASRMGLAFDPTSP